MSEPFTPKTFEREGVRQVAATPAEAVSLHFAGWAEVAPEKPGDVVISPEDAAAAEVKASQAREASSRPKAPAAS